MQYWDNLWASTSVPDIQERKAETKQMQTRAIGMTSNQKSLAHSSYQKQTNKQKPHEEGIGVPLHKYALKLWQVRRETRTTV